TVESRLKSASNMRQIGQAIMLHANAHDGMTPPDLGTLAMTLDIGPSAFINPMSGTRVPRGLVKDPARADWTNRNSSYVYIQPNVKLAAIGPGGIVAYEREADDKGRVNVLFGDGHVEIMSKAELDKRLAP